MSYEATQMFETQTSPVPEPQPERYDNVRTSNSGSLMPGQLFTKGNMQVLLEKKREKAGNWRGRKAKEQTKKDTHSTKHTIAHFLALCCANKNSIK